MLDLMRRKKRLKVVLWLVILSLALGMLLFFVPGAGVSTYTFETSAASVDGDPIPMQELINEYARTIKNYSQNGKNKTDPATLKALGIGRQVLDGLINRRVVEYAAKRLGLEVTPEEIRQAIEANPNLQDQNGFIGVERYKALLAANNITTNEFEDGVRFQLLAFKVRHLITDSMDVSNKELRDEFNRTNQESQVSFVVLSRDDFKKSVAPTEAELRAYFDAHKDKYKIGEQRRAQYLLIPLQSLAATINVTDQEVQDEWAREGREETVDAAHILFEVKDPSKDAEVKAKAEEILKRAKAGEDFAELARKYSQDTASAKQGGDLGPFTRGRMVKPFEDVAFSLKPGQISNLVRTQFGYHIIKVLKHDIPTLSEYRDSVVRAVQLDRASDLAKQKAAEAQQLGAKEKDLNAIAKTLNVPTEIKETGFVTKDTNPFVNGLSRNMLDEIFKLKDINAVGNAVDVPAGYAVPKLLETKLPKPPDFTTSRATVEQDYIESKTSELMSAEAKKLSDEAVRLQSLEKAAKEEKLTIKTTQEFKRDAAPDAEIGSAPAFNAAAFDLPVGSVSGPILLPGGQKTAVLQVKSRTPFDEAAFEKQKDNIRDRILINRQDAYFQDYIRLVTDNLEKTGKIRVNPKALDDLNTIRY